MSVIGTTHLWGGVFRVASIKREFREKPGFVADNGMDSKMRLDPVHDLVAFGLVVKTIFGPLAAVSQRERLLARVSALSPCLPRP
jgi:hypothetical protein